MITVRKSADRGRAKLAWLDSRHTFSFGHYFDPRQLGFSELVVINDDNIAAAAGFDSHSHRDMEIISYVLQGALEHKDSIGTGSVIRPGDVQRMTAGSGISHSEFNPSATDNTRLLQIWIKPEANNLAPGYEQRHFEDRPGLTLVASQQGESGSVTIHQDVRLYRGQLDTHATVGLDVSSGRKAWLQLAIGSITLNGILLEEGDGAAITDETALNMQAEQTSEFLLFDLP